MPLVCASLHAAQVKAKRHLPGLLECYQRPTKPPPPGPHHLHTHMWWSCEDDGIAAVTAPVIHKRLSHPRHHLTLTGGGCVKMTALRLSAPHVTSSSRDKPASKLSPVAMTTLLLGPSRATSPMLWHRFTYLPTVGQPRGGGG
jgi:hypothetical protein